MSKQLSTSWHTAAYIANVYNTSHIPHNRNLTLDLSNVTLNQLWFGNSKLNEEQMETFA